MSRLTGNDAKGLMEAYNAVYAPQQEEVVEEVQDLQEIGVNFGGQAAVDKVRAQAAAEKKSAARIDALRQQRFGSGGAPSAAKPALAKAPATAKPAAALTRDQQMLKNLGPAQYAAFKGGGGFAALQKAGGTSDRAALGRVVAQGRQNIGRFDTKPAPAAAGGAKAPAPAATTKPAPPQRIIGDGSAAGKPSAASPATRGFQLAQKGIDLSKPSTPAAAAAPQRSSIASQIKDLQQMRKASQQRIMAQGATPATPLVQDVDLFDLVKGYLLDEGYAKTEEAALVIMANMGEEWRESIIEAKYGTKAGRKALAKKIRKGEEIGKSGPGTGFKAVEKAAKEGGAEDPEAVAAAAMWKTHGGKKG